MRDIRQNFVCGSGQFCRAIGLFYLLFQTVLEKLKVLPLSSDRLRIQNALRYMEAHAAEPFSVGQLAALSMMSESAFYKTFKKATGFTPINFKNRIRSRLAMEMLHEKSNKVESISAALGFSSPAYFRRVLQSNMRLSPKEARKKQGGL